MNLGRDEALDHMRHTENRWRISTASEPEKLKAEHLHHPCAAKDLVVASKPRNKDATCLHGKRLLQKKQRGSMKHVNK